MNNWYTNKILGDFAESVCHSHFDALGYHVEHTGVEKFALMLSKFSNESTSKSFAAKTIMNYIHKTPDLLISRLYKNQLQSFMVEVKYRTSIKDMEQFENELLWNYRNVIWKSTIFEAAGFSEDEKINWKSNTLNLNLIQKVKRCKVKYLHIKLSIIFYVVIKYPENDQTYVYCNLATSPKWWNAGDKNFESLKNGTYESTNEMNNYRNFNDIYFNEIKPALDQLFK